MRSRFRRFTGEVFIVSALTQENGPGPVLSERVPLRAAPHTDESVSLDGWVDHPSRWQYDAVGKGGAGSRPRKDDAALDCTAPHNGVRQTHISVHLHGGTHEACRPVFARTAPLQPGEVRLQELLRRPHVDEVLTDHDAGHSGPRPKFRQSVVSDQAPLARKVAQALLACATPM